MHSRSSSRDAPGEDEGWSAPPSYYSPATSLTGNSALQEPLHTFSPSKSYSVAFGKHSFCSSFGNPHPKQNQDFTLAGWADIVVMSNGWDVKCQE